MMIQTTGDKMNLLKTLRENICGELNEEDTSVGFYAVSDLTEWATECEEHIEGITITSASKEVALLECEGVNFEIFKNNDGEQDFWDIRLI